MPEQEFYHRLEKEPASLTTPTAASTSGSEAKIRTMAVDIQNIGKGGGIFRNSASDVTVPIKTSESAAPKSGPSRFAVAAIAIGALLALFLIGFFVVPLVFGNK